MTLIAPFEVTGAPKKRENWVRSALASLDPDVDPLKLLPRTIPLRFGPVKNVPGTNSPAVGYTIAGPATEVRHGMPNADNLSRETTEYVILHEGFGHARMKLVPISKAVWKQLKALVKGPTWKPELGISARYWFNDLEVIIDAAVEAISGVVSPYTHDPARPDARARYRRWVDQADYPTVKTLWLKGLTASVPDPEPDPEPEPLPEPVDPCAVVVSQLTEERDEARVALATAEVRLLAKDNFMKEGLTV